MPPREVEVTSPPEHPLRRFELQYKKQPWIRRQVTSFLGSPPLRPQDRLPPSLPGYKYIVLIFADLAIAVAAGFLAYICLSFLIDALQPPSCSCYFYFAGLTLISGVVLDRMLRHPRRVHEERIQDRSEIEALIVECLGVTERWIEFGNNQYERPKNHPHLKSRILLEVDRLTAAGPQSWTEYEVLSLSQNLVAFLTPGEVIAQSRSMLAEIEDYANDSAYRYEMRNLDRIRDQIESGIQRIQKHRDDQQDLTGANNNPSNDVAIDDSADELRAALVDLYEHLAGYQREWAHGSALIRALVTCGSTSVLMLTAMGTLPWYYFQVRMPLEMYNWALLGAAGSITSLLLSYYKYRIVEIGNTEGKQELLRAALAATLGTIAGLITYAIAWFGVIDGPIIPVVYSPDPKHIAGSIAAAIGAGFVFESVFERLKLKSQDVYGQ